MFWFGKKTYDRHLPAVFFEIQNYDRPEDPRLATNKLNSQVKYTVHLSLKWDLPDGRVSIYLFISGLHQYI